MASPRISARANIRRGAVLAAVLVFASVGNLALAQKQFAPPPQIKRFLDARYPGWRMAKPSDGDIATCFDKQSPFHPSAVWGDFNGDGMVDHALQVTHRGTTTVMVFMSDGKVHVLEQWATDFGHILGVSRKGSSYYDSSDRKRAFSEDAVKIIFCERGEYDFFFQQGRVRKVSRH